MGSEDTYRDYCATSRTQRWDEEAAETKVHADRIRTLMVKAELSAEPELSKSIACLHGQTIQEQLLFERLVHPTAPFVLQGRVGTPAGSYALALKPRKVTQFPLKLRASNSEVSPVVSFPGVTRSSLQRCPLLLLQA